MKILDRYIMASVAGTFLFGIAMFMGLLLAMDLMKKLVELIAEQGVPAMLALKIFAYRMPSMLSYAFPMSVLLAIMLVFNRMSSESEMVAIRAAGISFMRIVLPTLLFALLVSGLTHYIADVFAPYASKRATELTRQALDQKRTKQTILYEHKENNQIQYAILATDLDLQQNLMHQVIVIYYHEELPAYFIYADRAHWLYQQGRWEFIRPTLTSSVDPRQSHTLTIESIDDSTQIDIVTLALKVRESPFDLATSKKRPEEFTARELRMYADHLSTLGQGGEAVGKWRMGFFQRYATSFSCLIFALIAAPLGLRHHRTSSAVGLGISLLVIFGYYSLSVYLNTFGENDRMAAWLAAWLPNMVGAIIGGVLIYRANK